MNRNCRLIELASEQVARVVYSGNGLGLEAVIHPADRQTDRRTDTSSPPLRLVKQCIIAIIISQANV